MFFFLSVYLLRAPSGFHHQFSMHGQSACQNTKEDSGCYDHDDDAFLDNTTSSEICLTSPGLSKEQNYLMRQAERVLLYVEYIICTIIWKFWYQYMRFYSKYNILLTDYHLMDCFEN